MALHGKYNDFEPDNFPPIPDTSNEETGTDELYPERLQDDINNTYTHDKVLPRTEGIDYVKDDKFMNDDDAETSESKSTFPYKY